MRARPALIALEDRTLVQHCGSDAYANLIEKDDSDAVVAVNQRVNEMLTNGGEPELWEMMSGRNIFTTQRERLDRWLEVTGSRRVVFGHNPHGGARPGIYHGGKAMNFDGGFSRYHRLFRRVSPLSATVAPLPAIGD
jgi:hypothetical protein